MNPFIPALSFPISFNFGGRKKESEAENSAKTPEAVPESDPSVTPAAVTDAGCDVCLDLDQLLMIGVVVSILILSTAVVVYAARQ